MWIARNSNGCVWLHDQKPTRIASDKGGYWVSDGHKMPIALRTPHPRWCDEPVPVKLTADWITESTKE